MKSEPTEYSIADLKADRVTCWDGVRNYQARNFMRDAMQINDGVFFYHSVVEPIGIVGEAKVVKCGYPDYTGWDRKDKHYDPKTSPANPIWSMVDVAFVRACGEVITLSRLRTIPALEKMEILRRGSRLSVSPVTEEEYKTILTLREW
ncbi:MAG: EVE domain-containing protein [Nitrospirae bacterium]|nr:EVE domain-containing protein [Candidatus Troglogloeales bacterium]